MLRRCAVALAHASAITGCGSPQRVQHHQRRGQHQDGVGLVGRGEAGGNHQQQRRNAQGVLHGGGQSQRAPGSARTASGRRHGEADGDGAGTSQRGQRRQQPMVELHGGDVLGQVAQERRQPGVAVRHQICRPSAGRYCSRSRHACRRRSRPPRWSALPARSTATASAAERPPARQPDRGRPQHVKPGPHDGGVEHQRQTRWMTSRYGETAVVSGKKPEATMNQPTAPCSPPSTNSSSRRGSRRPLDPAGCPEPDQRTEKRQADQPAPQAVESIPARRSAEAGQAEALVQQRILRDLLVEAEQLLPVGLVERRQDAGDRRPFHDRQAGAGQPRDAAEHDHRPGSCRRRRTATARPIGGCVGWWPSPGGGPGKSRTSNGMRVTIRGGWRR